MERLVESRSSHRLSGFISRLSHYSARTGLTGLNDLILGTRRYDRDQPAWAERGDLAHICVLEDGWAYKFCFFPDGRRHIPDFFGRGAICNWFGSDPFGEQDDILFKAGATVAFLDRRGLEELLRNNPTLAASIERHELARSMRATQRVRAFISLTAKQKFLLLLLDIASELDPWGSREGWHKLPMLQIELADCLGITPVHVSRLCVKLERQGLIERSRENQFRLCDPRAIEQMLTYRDFFVRASHRL